MLRARFANLVLGLGCWPAVSQAAEPILPFPVSETTLENGLKVIFVQTGSSNLVSLQIAVQTGSRNEVEPGKTGFAHFFEHMMFRGTKRHPPEVYQQTLARAGASGNAYTTDDYTNYHITFAREDLDRMLEIEADRFMNLDYPLAAFRTEALAVLGEYNKNFSNPLRKLFEVQQNAAYQTHTYKHTTLGFLEDIKDMPNQYEYSRTFFERWYRPEYVTLLVAGDVTPEEVLPLVEKHFGHWRRGDYRAEIPAEPEPHGPLHVHHAWPTPTMPLLAVSFHGPAFSETEKDSAALELLLALTFGETSDLYGRLVQEEQTVDLLSYSNADSVDPSLLTVLARVKDAQNVLAVRDAVLQAFAAARQSPVEEARLREAVAHRRYAFVAGLDTTEAIGGLLARSMHIRRSLQAVENLFRLYDGLTPEDLCQAARKYFTDERLVITTLAGEALDPALATPPSLDSLGAAAPAEDTSAAAKLLVQKTASPQIELKLLFLAGSADDPPGKEGLAQLAANMIADAGSSALDISDIKRLFYPMAGSFNAQVDREMTVFGGSIHLDNVEPFLNIILGMLLDPGMRPADFTRLRERQQNELKIDLCSNNDEELGKERLQASIFAGTPYGHPTVGTAAGLAALTIEDVRAFAARHYTWNDLIIGLAGDVPDALVERLTSALRARLPAGEDGARHETPAARKLGGLSVEIVQKDTRATAISLGHAIEVTRSHPDFVPLYLARTWLGEHRSSLSHLYQRLREERGMNYGDYAYIEAFPGGMFQFRPAPNRARLAQIFEIWIRPVEPAQAHMALRIALHELERLAVNGLSEEQFQATREYLMKSVFVLTDGAERGLGYLLDSRFYGIPEFTAYMRERLAKLTCEEVNAAVRRHLCHDRLHAVMVTKDAEGLRAQLLADGFSRMTYNSEKPAELLAEDQVIGARRLGLRPEDVTVTPVEQVFAE